MRISLNKLSELSGMTWRTVKKRLKDLRPIDKEANAFVYESADALRVLYAADACGDDRPDPVYERALLDRAKRLAQEMRNKELEGELAPIAEIASTWALIVTASRTKVLGIKSKVAPLVVELVEDPEIREAILSAIDDRAREALNELAAWRPPGDEDEQKRPKTKRKQPKAAPKRGGHHGAKRRN